MALARPGTLLDGQAASAVGLQCYLGALEAANTQKRYDVPGTLNPSCIQHRSLRAGLCTACPSGDPGGRSPTPPCLSGRGLRAEGAQLGLQEERATRAGGTAGQRQAWDTTCFRQLRAPQMLCRAAGALRRRGLVGERQRRVDTSGCHSQLTWLYCMASFRL